MNETYIQTIRGGIQHVIHLAKDHWTQTPKPCGFYSITNTTGTSKSPNCPS